MIPLRCWIIPILAACFLIALGARGHAETGTASYYGGKHHGRPTASGERFNQHSNTCAHRFHEFGSVLRVAHRGRSVECKVSDRGPFIRGRVVDLSVASARALGIISAGVARVTVERIR